MSGGELDYRRFARLAKRHNCIPVLRERLADLETPVSAFGKLQAGEGSFLLESVSGGDTWGRYSILGAGALGRFHYEAGELRVRWRGRTRRSRPRDPLASLRKWLGGFDAPALPGLPRFAGGAVGHISYDAVRLMEDIPDRHADQRREPELDLLLVGDLVVFDNVSHTLKLVACAFVDGDPRAAWDDAQARLDHMERALEEPDGLSVPAASGTRRGEGPPLRSNTKRRDWDRAVRRAREYIQAGDIFQVVLSHELEAPLRAAPLDVYRAMRCINPSPYMFYLDMGGRQVLGASPEVLVRVEDGEAVVRPIAGTRRRGGNPAEDRERWADLEADPKERAEHVMLVDLGRNDIGRVCDFGSVVVDPLMVPEHYSHVIHMVSEVRGQLREGLDCFDALRASFPAGTVSGAPKIRAMEIIDELEQRRRGVYAGAVGWFSFDGSMDTCIAIRTVVCEEGRARVGVGAGIVLDSNPEREWEETMEKAGAARAALALAEGGLVL